MEDKSSQNSVKENNVSEQKDTNDTSESYFDQEIYQNGEKVIAKIFPHGDHLHIFHYDDIMVNSQEEAILERLSEEEKAQIRAKKEYLVYVFSKTPSGNDAVPYEAIKLSERDGKLYFLYNEPMMEYDPTHIHPTSVPVERVVIPQRSDDFEIDFINELEATGWRVGIVPEELRVENGRFIIPHGSHNHSIPVKSGGYELYKENKIEVEKKTRIEGEIKY